ncbi:MAG: hypothetical protein V1932_07445 [Chloroflexota bacterium]
MELDELIRSIKKARSIPTEGDLRSLPHKKAFIYGRVSSQGQVKDSRESIHEVAKLVVLAKKDGYHSNIESDMVGKWLDSIHNREDLSLTMEDGEIAIVCRDLGLSGSLGEDKRPGLKALWKRVETGEMGTVYLTEGMSRLSRDRDRVLGYKLLRLLKEQRCRIRTPEGVYNPAVSRDWDCLADDIDDSAEEMKKMGIRLGRRRVSKAAQGRHVGSPVCPGYIVEIEGQRNDGSYILGKWQPYPPHQEIVITALKELVKQRSIFKAVQSLTVQGIVFPFFSDELKYMETRSALRLYRKSDVGYVITTNCLKNLATNLRLIGIWEWSDIIIEDNHPAIVPVDLFLQAYEIAVSNKPRGKAAYAEPMEWAGLLYCYNHEYPRKIAAYSTRKRWACDHDKHLGIGQRCLYIEDHLLTLPLTREFLRYLDFTSHAQVILEKLKSETSEYSLEEARWRRQDTELSTRLSNLKKYLGTDDPEREETYWQLIQEVKEQIELLGEKSPPPKTTPVDIERVTEFLENLESNWEKNPSSLRNRLLTLLIDRVEIRHDREHIKATIVWKAGFNQVVRIQRLQPHCSQENRWSAEETKLLRMLWPSASWDTILVALPDRNRSAIYNRATRLRLSRQGIKKLPENSTLWTQAEIDRLKESYVKDGLSIIEIADELGRTEHAVEHKITSMKLKRPKELRRYKQQPVWNVGDFKVMDSVWSQIRKLP